MKSHWKETAGMTVIQYSRSRPDYLNSIFPRSISGWNNLYQREQDYLKEQERKILLDSGYIEQENGSWLICHQPCLETPCRCTRGCTEI